MDILFEGIKTLDLMNTRLTKVHFGHGGRIRWEAMGPDLVAIRFCDVGIRPFQSVGSTVPALFS